MKINALDHVNIITEDLAGTVKFFVDIFGFEVRDGPDPLPAEYAKWLYDDHGRAILHINDKRMGQSFARETPPGPVTGAIHHVALDCSGHNEFVAHLEKHNIEYRLNAVPSVTVKQIFFHEPNGVLLELNFQRE